MDSSINLPDVLARHAIWLTDRPFHPDGQADLRDTDLRHADLRYADLRRADLCHADLRHASLYGAGLRHADLRGADLRYADLCGADLRYADLRHADLRHADLRDAADLRGADLRRANLKHAKLPHFQIQQEGELIVWKAAEGALVKLRVPADAKRTACLVSRKCRASVVETLGIWSRNGQTQPFATGWWTGSCTYIVNHETHPDSYDDDTRIECTRGIHFFLTREEALGWLGWPDSGQGLS